MLDVHPAHHAASSWREFFIHIATIVIGLLIAVSLEQTLEAIHHHHERSELTERMRVEAEHNLRVLKVDSDRLLGEIRYLGALRDALLAGKVTPNAVEVQGVVPPGISITITSPSRGTWQAAQAAGLIALLPPEQAELYARVDFNAQEEQNSEDPMTTKLSELASECERTGYNHSMSDVSRISLTERKDLIYKIGQLNDALAFLGTYQATSSGGYEAIVAGALTLDQIYPYQEAALAKLYKSDPSHSASMNFYGGVAHPNSRTNLYNGSESSK